MFYSVLSYRHGDEATLKLIDLNKKNLFRSEISKVGKKPQLITLGFLGGITYPSSITSARSFLSALFILQDSRRSQG